MRKKFILLCIVFLELVVIAFLAVRIYLNQSKVLGETVSINPISKDDVIFPSPDTDSDLKYFYEPAPNTIINNKPSWLSPDYSYTITTNTDSLNERFDYSIEKNPDVFRIVTIGNSFTYGQYVDTKENYPERLEDMLNDNSLCKSNKKFEVINLGVGGYDIEYSVNRFKARGQKYSPDLVLWFLMNHDFSQVNEILRPKVNQYRKEMLADEDLMKNFYEKGEYFPWTTKAVQELAEAFNKEGGLEYQKVALQRINDYYKGKLAFVTFSNLIDKYMSALRDFAEARGDTYFYNEISEDYDRFADGHPTSKGYAQIDEQIFDYLTQNGFVPCSLP
jgi:hypothetical protein